ncbi:MAG TPA: hypothetical protein VK071_06380 [Tissierellales bacterium]|nr:hypothetical protein [Tissierellales bacterium]
MAIFDKEASCYDGWYETKMGSYVDKVETELPVKTIRPTYVNRKEELLKESFEFA